MWLGLSLLGALLFAITNLVDKHLISRRLPEASAGAMTILTGLVSVPFAVVFGWLARADLARYDAAHAAGAIAAGLLLAGAINLYYRSLATGDTTSVVILFQLSVVFNYILGWVFLGEHIPALQTALLIAVVLTWVGIDVFRSGGKLRVRGRVVALMMVASLAASGSDVMFKRVALGTSYLPTQFFIYVAAAALAIGMFAVSAQARRVWLEALRQRPDTLALAGINESTSLVGLMVVNLALLLAPIAFVQAAVSAQGVFTLLLRKLLRRQ
jgi:uncharacterized membrane protein